MKLGDVLRAWRMHRELDLRTAAKTMGIGAASTLMRIEQGEGMDGKTLAKILAWLMKESTDGK